MNQHRKRGGPVSGFQLREEARANTGFFGKSLLGHAKFHPSRLQVRAQPHDLEFDLARLGCWMRVPTTRHAMTIAVLH